MAGIVTPPVSSGNPVKSLGQFIEISGAWHERFAKSKAGMLSDLWYRGVNRWFDVQVPGVYRKEFTQRADLLNVKGVTEDKRLHLERNVVSQFKTAGAPFLVGLDDTQIYMTAQHYGTPTRLLDWSTNPLAALFFACCGEPSEDGYVHAMDAALVIPDKATKLDGMTLYRSVMTTRNPYVQRAIAVSFWGDLDKRNPYILPVRPDTIPGRIGQQSSCFTLHMHKASDVRNPAATTVKVDKSSKEKILKELHRVNINQFTAYYDLDHLSKELIRGWQCGQSSPC
jgi:hypothetical protein